MPRDIRSFKLENGVTAVVEHRPDAVMISANVTVLAGAADDPSGQFGMAHILEHTTTPRGSKGEAYADLLERRGALGVNAVTNWDVTQYFADLPRAALPLWLELEAKRLISPSFHRFRSERDSAIREAAESPGFGAMAPLLRGILQANELHSPFGVESQMSRIDLPSAARFFHSHYLPARTVLTFVGSAPVEEIRELCGRFFGSWKGSPTGSAEDLPPPARSPLIATYSGAAYSALLLGVRRSGLSPRETAALSVLTELIESPQLSPVPSAWNASAWPFLPGRRGDSLAAIVLFGLPGTSADQLRRAGVQLPVYLLQSSDEALLGAIRFHHVKLVERIEQASSFAAGLGEYQAVYGSWKRLTDEAEESGRLTPDLVRASIATLFAYNGFFPGAARDQFQQ